MKTRFAPLPLLAAIALAAFLPRLASAEFLIHPLFTDHCVLQQELPVPVWGWGDPDQKVTVEFGGQKKETNVEGNGAWLVLLDPLTASDQPASLTASSQGKTITVSDLLIGEVWVCSGQSNMAMTVSRSSDAESARTAATEGKLKSVRLFKVPVAGADERSDTVKSAWQPCSPATVDSFSAAGFYFGQALNVARKVPVGLIQSANGGTNAFSWINSDTFQNDPVAAPTREVWEQAVATFPQATERYENAREAWNEKVKAAKAAGKPAPEGRAPQPPLGPGHVKRPAGHYNAMIAPLQPYAIRGALWYQGEANSRPPFAPQYRDLMLALVEDWRADWAAALPEVPRRDFPFYLVQLPNFGGGHPQGWPVIREQMLKFWQDGKNTGMVVSIDVGDPKDIHPTNKKPVGERLARFTRAKTYGEDIVAGGPIFDSISIDGGKAILKFQSVGGGLVSTDNQPLRHFTIAGSDTVFVAAQAEIFGDTIVVSSPEISAPRAVRYAWSNDPENVNFANRDGLPASPFRTDNWEIPLDAEPASTPAK
ncbi:MAG: sialate O-acetylesterase [Verrucomicrobiae bacterium]|nr:sialate O-acetylesterase [Verrucomicrobiae bacterium]